VENFVTSSHVVASREQTDKASMLDEAIEYLKSLQLQVQVSDRDSDLALSSPLAVRGTKPILTNRWVVLR